MISAVHLTKRYRDYAAVDDISFEVAKGEVVGFMGPNGAGKTTVMRILAGYLAASGGTVRVAGFDVRTESMAVRRRIGYLPESVPLYPDMRVDEYLRYRARIKRVRSRRLWHAVADVKERCGLQQVGRELIGSLSRGYRQRVGLADALVHDPDLLILDEPMLGLDPHQNRKVRDLIHELAEHRTILLCSHILPEVEQTCSRIVIIQQGRIVAADTPERLKESLDGAWRVQVQIRGPADTIQQQLNVLPGVKSAEIRRQDSWLLCRVESVGTVDLPAAIFDAVVRNGWSLRELKVLDQSLEEAYLGATRADAPTRGGMP